MNAPSAEPWLNMLLGALHAAQLALLHAAHALGIAGDSHGQPAWPWARRVAAETLRLDLGVARALGAALAMTSAAALIAAIALVWRRRRIVLLSVAVLSAACAPWPAPSLWLADAVPTSFRTNPEPFSVVSAMHGARLYAAHCAACHGDDGRGEGPLARTLGRWPPTVVGPLLGRRLDGELFWRVVAGMRDAHGAQTMPGFAGRLSDGDVRAVLDYLTVLAARGGAQSGDGWPLPVRLPALDVRCADSAPQPLAHWRGGQRVRVVALGDRDAPPVDDARWQTLLVTRDGRAPATSSAAGRAACVAATPGAWDTFAALAGVEPQAFAGAQLLADRDGWLRAAAKPGERGWRDADLLCTSAPPSRRSARPSRGGGDALTALLRRIDAQPVRHVQGGFVH
ncbi:c-type cytochrome [Burkholderia mayonis]|uniref:Cytochrome C n=1 Tax=Burkholderia mayonis TaxID=1385591 RepID=A0A1B4FWQ9_9BURK|nr:cytochrome c [Burkholderia mayonis]AOJ08099.1 cytochrome C [Burkholderia mayonis]KVE57810.1 cytochrome C [Burkholderia mayonis]